MTLTERLMKKLVDKSYKVSRLNERKEFTFEDVSRIKRFADWLVPFLLGIAQLITLLFILNLVKNSKGFEAAVLLALSIIILSLRKKS